MAEILRMAKAGQPLNAGRGTLEEPQLQRLRQHRHLYAPVTTAARDLQSLIVLRATFKVMFMLTDRCGQSEERLPWARDLLEIFIGFRINGPVQSIAQIKRNFAHHFLDP